MDAQTRFRTQLVGALPAVVHYFDELDLAATIDELVPWEGDVPLGTLVEVLVANRLLQPTALFRIGPWAQSAALTDYYGLTPEQLNDDRLGRALERLDAAALERWQALEGVYVLKTNLPVRTHPVAEVLRAYKGQSRVERRFHHLKGPLAVAPVFLKNPDRIAGLLCVLVWALMVLALMERQARQELGGEPLYGLYPEGRASPSPTGPSLLQGLSGLCIVIAHRGDEVVRRLAQPDPVQRRILQLLGVNSERLQTFRRRCGT